MYDNPVTVFGYLGDHLQFSLAAVWFPVLFTVLTFQEATLIYNISGLKSVYSFSFSYPCIYTVSIEDVSPWMHALVTDIIGSLEKLFSVSYF